MGSGRGDFDTRQMAEDFRAAAPHSQWTVIVAEYAEILRESYWAEESTLGEVLHEAERVSEYMWEEPDVSEFVDLLRKASRLHGE